MDDDKSKTGQFSHSQAQAVSTEIYDKAANKNIEDLKKLQKIRSMFKKIYAILNRITAKNDFAAMDYAVKEKFCDVENEYGETIFYHIIKQCNFQLARLIMEFSENNYSHIMLKNSVFNIFVLKTRHFDAKEAHEVVKLLLTVPGIDVNAKERNKRTALLYASENGQHEVVKFLLTVPGIDVNTKDKFGNTALIYASENGYHKVVKLLLTVPGIDVNAINENNRTALINASWKGHHEVVKLLLAVPGIDVNAKDINNYTALIWASWEGYHEVIKLLLTVPGIDVNTKDINSYTALLQASENGHHEVVKLLLTVPGIDVNAKEKKQKDGFDVCFRKWLS